MDETNNNLLPQDPNEEAVNLIPDGTTDAGQAPLSSEEGRRNTAVLGALAEIGLSNGSKTLDDFETIADEKVQAIDQGHENWARNQIGAMKESNDIDTRDQIVQDILEQPEEVRQGIGQDVYDILQQMASQSNDPYVRKLYGLEEEGTKQMVNLSSASDPDTAINNENRAIDFDAYVQESLAKDAIFSRILDRAKEEWKSTSLTGKVIDVGTSVLNPVSSILARTGNTEGRDGASIFNLSERFKEDIANMRSLPMNQFVEAVESWYENIRNDSAFFGTNSFRTVEILEEALALPALGVSERETFSSMNVWAGVDVLSLMPLGKLNSVNKLMKGAGGEKVLSSVTANQIRKAEGVEGVASIGRATKGVVGEKDVVDNSLHSVFRVDTLTNPSVGLEDVSLSTRVRQELDSVDASLREILNETLPSRLTDVETQTLASRSVETAKLKYGNTPTDIRFNEAAGTIGNDINSLTLTWSSPNGLGYANEAAAKARAKRVGLDEGNYTVVRSPSGKYHVQKVEAVSEEGIIRPSKVKATDEINVFQRVLRSGAYLTQEHIHTASVQATQLEQSILNNIIKPVVDRTIVPLSKKSRDKLNDIIAVTRDNERWFSPQELVGRGLDDQEIVGYYGYQKLADMEYFLSSYNELIRHTRQGMKKFTISSKSAKMDTRTPFIGKEVPDVRYINPDKDRLFSVVDNKTMVRGSYSQQDLKQMLQNGDVTIIKSSEAMRIDGQPYTYFIVKKSDAIEKELTATDMLGYKAGGHRVYPNPVFVKQANIGKYVDDGSEFVDSDSTLIVARTTGEAQEYADNMESARQALLKIEKEGWTKENKALIQGKDNPFAKTSYGSYQDFSDAVNKGLISSKVPFELTRDGEMTRTAIDTMSRGGYELTDKLVYTSPLQTYRTNRKGFNAKRGDHLLGPNGERAEVVDAFEALSDGIYTAARSTSYNNYAVAAVENWAARADMYGVSQGTTARDTFMKGLPESAKKDLPIGVYERLKGEREVVMRNLNFRTTLQRTSENMQVKLVNKIEQHLGTPAAKRWMGFSEKIGNPIDMAKQAAFHFKLGLYQLGQVTIQSQSALAAFTIDPVNATKATAKAFALGFYAPRTARMAGNNAYKDVVTKMFDGWEGNTAQEMKLMIDEALKSNWLEIGTGHMYLDKIGKQGSLAASSVGRLATRGLENSQVFFNLGESTNRVFSYTLAWERYKTANNITDLTKMTTKEARAAIIRDADNLTFNMTSASAAAWNKGILSVPGQFMSFQARTLDSLFGKRLTRAEKTRLIIGQTVMYGAAGIGARDLNDYVMEQYKAATGETVSPELAKYLTSGIWDGIMYSLSDGEADTDLAKRAAILQGVVDMAKSYFADPDIDPTAKTLREMLFGAAGGTLGQLYDAFKPLDFMVQLAHAESWGERVDIAGSHLQEIGAVARSWSDYTKAYSILKEQQYYSARTGQQMGNATIVEAYATALGIPLGADSMRNAMLGDLTRTEKAHKEIAQFVNKYRTQVLKAIDDNDDNARLAAQNIINRELSKFDDMERNQIVEMANRLNKNYGTAMEGTLKRYYEKFGDNQATDMLRQHINKRGDL